MTVLLGGRVEMTTLLMGFLPSVEMTVLLGGRIEMTTLFLGFLPSVEMTDICVRGISPFGRKDSYLWERGIYILLLLWMKFLTFYNHHYGSF